MKTFCIWLVASLLATVQAAAYPERPIRVVVPYVAGGAADITARVIAQKMTDSLGVPVVVENKPGANGMIGTDFVAKSKPDGYTLLFDASGPLVINPLLYASVPYDPLTDLSPISQVTRYQYVLVTHRDSPIRSVDDLIAAARANPGALSYGSAGIGAGGHLAGELLGQMTQIQLTHVPYKGNAQALTDALSGQLSFTFDTIVTLLFYLTDCERPMLFTGDAAKNRAELLARTAIDTGDSQASCASLNLIWAWWRRAPDTLLVPGHDLCMRLDADDRPVYVGERRAALNVWFGQTLEPEVIDLCGTQPR